ncbi:hypothetical protein H6F43_16820 [Leptolyngbya sp. FACHB-36]|uniref:hypothetical protein n=1 Tax=Leptolyngbya sp. FACHB-36 TaxID=2692808 RepID=UPI00168033F4|nr:hypothetical protein [Leptolyngbya sp. FACHB-36]MBD2021845.1 hypothetical protein [Leptolyngbya sp. FACHB-36]
MRKLFLTLLSCPALLGSAFCYLTVLAPPASATTAPVRVSDNLYCDRAVSITQRQFTCVRVTAAGTSAKQIIDLNQASKLAQAPLQLEDADVLEFTDEESDAAAALFGCDCPACLNALRQLRSLGNSLGS